MQYKNKEKYNLKYKHVALKLIFCCELQDFVRQKPS
jgi:hypothetical protein